MLDCCLIQQNKSSCHRHVTCHNPFAHVCVCLAVSGPVNTPQFQTALRAACHPSACSIYCPIKKKTYKNNYIIFSIHFFYPSELRVAISNILKFFGIQLGYIGTIEVCNNISRYLCFIFKFTLTFEGYNGGYPCACQGGCCGAGPAGGCGGMY